MAKSIGAVRLREVEEADLDLFFAMQNDEAASQMSAFTPDEPDNRQAFDEKWAKMPSDPNIVVRTILSGEVVAGNIMKFDFLGQPNLGYGVRQAFWGQGIATAALRLMLEEVRERPLYGRAAKDNLASIRVLEKCGFQPLGEELSFANARGKKIPEVILRLD